MDYELLNIEITALIIIMICLMLELDQVLLIDLVMQCGNEPVAED